MQAQRQMRTVSADEERGAHEAVTCNERISRREELLSLMHVRQQQYYCDVLAHSGWTPTIRNTSTGKGPTAVTHLGLRSPPPSLERDVSGGPVEAPRPSRGLTW